jgi:hypothetical protein
MVTDKLYQRMLNLLRSSARCSVAQARRQWQTHKFLSNNEVWFSAQLLDATLRQLLCLLCTMAGLSALWQGILLCAMSVFRDSALRPWKVRELIGHKAAELSVLWRIYYVIWRQTRNCIHMLTWFLSKHATVYCPFNDHSLPCIGLQVTSCPEIHHIYYVFFIILLKNRLFNCRALTEWSL